MNAKQREIVVWTLGAEVVLIFLSIINRKLLLDLIIYAVMGVALVVGVILFFRAQTKSTWKDDQAWLAAKEDAKWERRRLIDTDLAQVYVVRVARHKGRVEEVGQKIRIGEAFRLDDPAFDAFLRTNEERADERLRVLNGTP